MAGSAPSPTEYLVDSLGRLMQDVGGREHLPAQIDVLGVASALTVDASEDG